MYIKTITLICLIMVMGFASANDMQIIKLGEQQKVFIQCTNNGLACSGSETATITIYYPNKTLYILGQPMTKEDGILYRNVTLDVLGVYTASGYVIDGSLMSPFAFNFEVTAVGKETTQGDLITYAFSIIFFMCLFFVSGYGFLKISGDNNRNNQGFIESINWLKYLKWFCGVMAYLTLTAIVYFMWNISYAFLSLPAMENFLHYLFRIMIMVAYMLFVVVVILGGIKFIKDIADYNKLKRGLSLS